MMKNTVAIFLLLTSCASGTQSAADDLAAQQKYAQVAVYEPGSAITPPRLLKRVDPVAPEGFRESRTSAAATVEAVIDASGKVVDAWYVDGDRDWARILAYTVRRWKFAPATLGGEPIPVKLKITSTFEQSPR